MDALAVVSICGCRIHQWMPERNFSLYNHTLQKMTKYKDLKIEEETVKKFHKAKNLAEFKAEAKITISGFLEELLEPYFRKFDNSTITKMS